MLNSAISSTPLFHLKNLLKKTAFSGSIRLSFSYKKYLAILCVLFIPILVNAQPDFPPLSGRVVDNANLLDANTEAKLTRSLDAHENATTNQVVVATFNDIQGYDIETFGYQLGRFWGIGQNSQDNGVLLIVAREERKVRIEVGYGLEGELTDAIASDIIQNVILTDFKRGRFSSGIETGVSAIIEALGGQYSPRSTNQGNNNRNTPFTIILLVAVFIIIRLLTGMGGVGQSGYGGRHYGHHSGYRSRGGFGGGGFSGGGGGFGGGGASGGW